MTIQEQFVPLVDVTLHEEGQNELVETLTVLFCEESFLICNCLHKIWSEYLKPLLEGVPKGFPSDHTAVNPDACLRCLLRNL